MKKNTTKSINKGYMLFFVALACLFAFLAGVKAMQIPDRQITQTASETTAEAASTSAAAETTEPSAAQTSGTASMSAGTTRSGDKVVYLTFDDGPTTNTTNILDVLEQQGVHGTFFVIHTYDGCEAQIREIHERGHCVALHTYSHLYSIYRSEQAYFDDLGKISDLVYEATGTRSMLVRFPGGSSNTISRKYCQGIMTTLTKEVTKRGYTYFDWNLDSFDASAVHVSADKIVRCSTSGIGNMNEIVLLMHDAQAKTTTVDALPDIIKAYRDAGYRFDVLSKDTFTCHHTVNN